MKQHAHDLQCLNNVIECEITSRSMSQTNLREIHWAVTLILFFHNQKV